MLYCVGFLTDPHIPFHSPRALAAAMNCLADSRLKALYLGGDILDMYWAHDHGPKDPRVKSTLVEEREAGNKFLDDCDKTWRNIPKHFVEGNHETRYERYLIKNCPALFGITDIQLLLGMNERPNWKWHSYGTHQMVKIENTNIFTKHAPKGSSGSAIMNHNMCNLIFGHVHRKILETRVAGNGKTMQVFSPGWLGEGRNRAFSYVPGHQNWHQGFARIWIDSENPKLWSFEAIDIIDNRFCIAGGKKYRG